MSIEVLCQLVVDGKNDESTALAEKLLNEGVDAIQIISVLTKTMVEIGEKFSRLEIFLPAMMYAATAMKSVVKVLRPAMGDGKSGSARGKIVLGTVKGDVHEIGKNIVKLMLEAHGFNVKDLGYGVDSLAFIKEAEAIEADIIGASALMTTTMPHQQEIIELLKDKGLREKYKIVIGGSPTTQAWADEIGADLYCFDAGSAPRLITELLGTS